MFDGVLPGVTIATPTEDGMTSPPLSPSLEENEDTSLHQHNDDTQSFAHQRLAHLRAKREAICTAIELLEEAEGTARTLQDSPFSTSPAYWQVYQVSLLMRGPGVDQLWEEMQE